MPEATLATFTRVLVAMFAVMAVVFWRLGDRESEALRNRPPDEQREPPAFLTWRYLPPGERPAFLRIAAVIMALSAAGLTLIALRVQAILAR